MKRGLFARRARVALTFGVGFVCGGLLFGRADRPEDDAELPSVVSFTDLVPPVPAPTIERDEPAPPYEAQPDEPSNEAGVAARSEAEAAVLAWGRAQCDLAALVEEGVLETRDLVDAVKLHQVVVHGTTTFAVVDSACDLSGAYNYFHAVVAVRAGRVRPIAFAPWPSWARAAQPLDAMDGHEVVNAFLALHDGRLRLETSMLHRGLGDSGSQTTFELVRGRFVATELRVRSGGTFAPEETGPFPIVGPPARRCAASFESNTRPGITLVTSAGRRVRSNALGLPHADCERFTSASVKCGGTELNPDTEYGLVSEGDDWVVVRMRADQDEEVSVLRVPRGCAL